MSGRLAFSSALMLLVLLGASLPGCMGSLKQPDPAKRYYALTVDRAPAPASPGKPKLKVRRLNVSTAYATREFVYRLGENEFTTDYYNLFLVSPKDMLAETLRTWFERSPQFGAALAPESGVRPDYVLESSVLDLYGDFRDQAAPKAVVAIQCFLLHSALSEYTIALSKTYRVEVPLANRSPEALAGAYSMAVQELLTRLETDIAAVLTKQ